MTVVISAASASVVTGRATSHGEKRGRSSSIFREAAVKLGTVVYLDADGNPTTRGAELSSH